MYEIPFDLFHYALYSEPYVSLSHTHTHVSHTHVSHTHTHVSHTHVLFHYALYSTFSHDIFMYLFRQWDHARGPQHDTADLSVNGGSCCPHLGLFVEVRCQLHQPGGLDRRHVPHVVLAGLNQLVEDHPETRPKQRLQFMFGEKQNKWNKQHSFPWVYICTIWGAFLHTAPNQGECTVLGHPGESWTLEDS